MNEEMFVIDTCALISYFHNVLEGSTISISDQSMDIINNAFIENRIKLIFPTVIFIELFDKWFTSEENAMKIKTEIYFRIKSRENMEIKPFDKETLHSFLLIKDIEKGFEFDNHDKQVLASAITMNCKLITSDLRIIRYNERKKIIPGILS